jgi:hypothetical protein
VHMLTAQNERHPMYKELLNGWHLWRDTRPGQSAATAYIGDQGLKEQLYVGYKWIDNKGLRQTL